MTPEEFDHIIENNNGFGYVPNWMAQAIEHKTKNMTVYLAESKLYKINSLDRVLNTIPLINKIKVEVN